MKFHKQTRVLSLTSSLLLQQTVNKRPSPPPSPTSKESPSLNELCMVDLVIVVGTDSVQPPTGLTPTQFKIRWRLGLTKSVTLTTSRHLQSLSLQSKRNAKTPTWKTQMGRFRGRLARPIRHPSATRKLRSSPRLTKAKTRPPKCSSS